jgi:hypothetical protein
MSVLDSIAQEISPELPGIPWEQLEQKFGIPREEIVLHVTETASADASGFFAYSAILYDTYQRMEGILKQCVLTFQVEDNPATSQNEVVIAARALKSVQQSLNEVGTQVLSALRANAPVLSSSDAVNLEQEKYRAVISSTQLTCLYGVLMHVKGSMQLAAVAPEDIVSSADQLCKTMNGIIQMWDLGALDTLKRQQLPVSPVVVQPVGAIPAAIVVVVFATVAAGIIAWCVVSMTKQLEVNRQMKLICEDAIRRQDKHAMETCVELLKVNSVATGAGPWDGLDSIGKAVLFVGIGYVLIKLAGPVSKLLTKKGES